MMSWMHQAWSCCPVSSTPTITSTTLTRSVIGAINKPLFRLTSLYPIWAYLSEDDIRLSTQLACAELLLSGCTTAVDHHYIVSTTPDPFSIQCEAAEASGIRTGSAGSMSLGTSDGGLPPDSVIQTDEDILHQSERLIAKGTIKRLVLRLKSRLHPARLLVSKH